MTQSNPVIGADKSGLQYRNEDNEGKRALLTHHKGAEPPSYAEAGTLWLDDSAAPWLLKWYDGTGWIVQGALNTTAEEFTPFIGGAALGDASESVRGLVRRASNAEAEAGENTEKYITPAQLAEFGGGNFLESVSQGDLNTSVGDVSSSSVSTDFVFIGTLPGGQYGFGHTLLGTTSHIFETMISTDIAAETAKIRARRTNPAGSATITARQRYITASPPFDMGDGAVHGFLFLKLDAAGNILGHYLADVPPWGYNGPTVIRADKIDRKTGKKYRKILKPRSMEEYMDGATPEYIHEEITQDIKNADMALIPHPFTLEDGETVVLVDPMDGRIEKLLQLQNAGEEIAAAIYDGYFRPDNAALARKGPPGVMQVALKVF